MDDILEFYKERTKDKPGGQYYKIYHKGVYQTTEWARSIKDLKVFLLSKKIKFDKIQRMI